MHIDHDVIVKAKEKIGDDTPRIIVDELDIKDYDERNGKCCCPFHHEKTPSFIYNRKAHSFTCFGACHRSYDIIDVLMYKGATYAEACQKLFRLAGIKYPLGEIGVKTKRQYRYPKEIVCDDKQKVYSYFKTRCISKETLDRADVRQDSEGNVVFNYYDTNDVLTMVKYRPSRKVNKGETKCWCQKDADTAPLLFNMNRINVSEPLLICEGEPDCLSAIESGFTNAVSVPLGSGNFHWIEENFEWLQQFESIIICSDNDEAGEKMRKECVYRLGCWRTKVVEIPEYFIDESNGKRRTVNDLNEVLYLYGKEKVLDIIQAAKETPVPGVVDFSDVEDIDIDALDGIKTGIPGIDRYIMKLFYGTLTIVTGINGCVSADTEYFNGHTWKPIGSYTPGDLVLQYNKDGSTTLVEPEKYHKYPCDHFWKIRSNYGVDQLVSDQHNLVYLTSKGNLAKKNTLSLVAQHNASKHGFQGRFLTTFRYSGDGVPFTDAEIRLLCAVICDGNLTPREHSEAMCRVNLKKARKKERLERLLKEAGVPYDKRHYNPRDLEYVTYLFTTPIATKTFGEDWYSCTSDQLAIVAEEILYWDGCHSANGRVTFSTTDKITADFVQFAFSASGRRGLVSSHTRPGRNTEYTVSSASNIHPTIFNCKARIPIEQVPSPDGYQYCFTVPSGMLVLRHNNRINITGNSGKSSLLNQVICQALDQDVNAYLYSGELPNFQAKNWINYIFAGQRNVNEYNYGESVYYKVSKEAKQKISEYYRGRLFIRQDGESNRVSDVIKSMEESVRKYGTKLVILDNMTAMNLEGNDDNKYDKQAEFIMKLINFSVTYNVAVVLVVHPHKIDMMRRLSKMDVQGVSAVIDLAHRILSLYRVQEKDKQGVKKRNKDEYSVEPIHEDVIIDILKDRLTGYEGKSVAVYYDRPSKRFFTTEEELDHKYKWDSAEYTTPLPFPPPQLQDENGDDPF